MGKKTSKGKRDYDREYREYGSKPEQRKRRSERTMARRECIRKGKCKKGDDREVHHPDATKKGSLGKRTKVISKKKNRSMNRHKKGEKQDHSKRGKRKGK